MSVVAARIYPNRYEMAADSIVVLGASQRRDTGFAKLHAIDGLIVGAVGSCDESSLFSLFLKTRSPIPNEESIVEHIAEFSRWKKERTDSRSIENSYLLGFESGVFSVCGFLVQRVTNFIAIGAGADFATAALHLGHPPRLAVETAVQLSTLCEGPVVTITRDMFGIQT
jgi:ATP-dependent protease HslVU (ClpYQ) peptidase subunit